MLTKDEIKEQLDKIELRLKQYKDLGYDIVGSRKFILSSVKKIVPEVLELGTGKGHMALAIARAGYPLVSVDSDPEILQVAAARAESFGFLDKIKFTTGNVEKLQFHDRIFSTVICADLWHHLLDPGKALDEMLRVWNGKGSLVIADMDRKGLDIVAKIHAAEGGTHDEGRVSIEKAGDLLAQRGVRSRRFEGHCQIVFVAEKK